MILNYKFHGIADLNWGSLWSTDRWFEFEWLKTLSFHSTCHSSRYSIPSVCMYLSESVSHHSISTHSQISSNEMRTGWKENEKVKKNRKKGICLISEVHIFILVPLYFVQNRKLLYKDYDENTYGKISSFFMFNPVNKIWWKKNPLFLG